MDGAFSVAAGLLSGDLEGGSLSLDMKLEKKESVCVCPNETSSYQRRFAPPVACLKAVCVKEFVSKTSKASKFEIQMVFRHEQPMYGPGWVAEPGERKVEGVGGLCTCIVLPE